LAYGDSPPAANAEGIRKSAGQLMDSLLKRERF